MGQRSNRWAAGYGLTCEVDFICAHVDKDAEQMLLLYDIPSSCRAAHALQMLYLI